MRVPLPAARIIRESFDESGIIFFQLKIYSLSRGLILKKQNCFNIWNLSACQAKERNSSGIKKELSVKAT
jgi:hypothetical protein